MKKGCGSIFFSQKTETDNGDFVLDKTAIQKHKKLSGYIKIARPDHWIKNLFILPGYFAAVVLIGKYDYGKLFWYLVAAFFSTCFAASANYVINEWLDAKFDKFHPTKKNRPVVVSGLNFGIVMAEYVLLAIAGLGVSLLVNRSFAAMIAWLLLMGVLYNVEPFRTKDVPYLDVLSESVNNVIRLMLGWFVVTANAIPPCSIIIGYWMGGAFLMATKRFAEYRMIGDPERAGLYRESFKAYRESTLLASSFCYAIISTFAIGVFLVKYRIELLVSLPFLVALFTKYILIAYKEDSAAQKPEKLYREKGLMALSAAFAVSILIGGIVKLPWLKIFTGIDLVRF